ncbi:MAG: M48 family metalloprotease [Helicobacteraceae bacterium]|jgi:predicted Zn-dependent protease|nr:M48 family metalloprotease [Helicobacteraceae bacterium]
MRAFSLAATLIFASFLLAACAVVGKVAEISSNFVEDPKTAAALKQSGESIGKAAKEISPEEEYYIGRAVGASILARYKLYKGAPKLTAYLNEIVNAIAINSKNPEIYNGYHAAILDSPEINAFATSGGHILIARGLLESAKSEDELAAVIAHEIAHIQLRHSLNAIKTSRWTQAATTTGVSTLSAVGDGKDLGKLSDAFGDIVGDVVSVLVNSGYSKSQEFDADAKALSLLSDAGYDPFALVAMLEELQKNQASRAGGFNKTHPSPTDRIKSVKKHLSKYAAATTKSARVSRYNAAMKK